MIIVELSATVDGGVKHRRVMSLDTTLLELDEELDKIEEAFTALPGKCKWVRVTKKDIEKNVQIKIKKLGAKL